MIKWKMWYASSSSRKKKLRDALREISLKNIKYSNLIYKS